MYPLSEVSPDKPVGNVKSQSVADNTLFLAVATSAPNPGHIYAINTSSGREIWDMELNNPLFAPLSIARGTLFVGDKKGALQAFNTETHALIWQFQAKDSIGGVSISGDTVYVGSDDQNLYALDIGSGLVRWKIAVDGAVAFPPIVSTQAIYFSNAKSAYMIH